MKVSVVRPGDLCASEVARWTALQTSATMGRVPFMSHAYASAVGAVRRDAYIAVLEDSAGEPVGFFPFQRSRHGVGRPMGGPFSVGHGIVAAPETVRDPRDVVRLAGLAQWDFRYLDAAQSGFDPYIRGRSEAAAVDLSQGYGAYLQQRRGELISGALRKERKAAREVGSVRFEFHTSEPGVLASLMRWKSEQYRQTGLVDRFAVPWVVDLVERLLAVDDVTCAPSLSALWFGDMLVAAHFGVRYQENWSYWFPAYSPEASRLSPGIILFLKMAEAAVDQGIRRVDLGPGDEAYKWNLANCRIALAAGSVPGPSRRRLTSRVRTSIGTRVGRVRRVAGSVGASAAPRRPLPEEWR